MESTVGVGSKCWCELPTAEAHQFSVDRVGTGMYVKPQRHRGEGQHRLLYIEENPANIRLAEQLIAQCSDIILITAVNGIRGLELARAALPTVILMDIHLSGMSGIEGLKILRHDPLNWRIPVVALSDNAMPRDIERGLELGVFRYLTKPIKVEQFMETLDEALEFAGRQAEPVI